MFPQSALRDSPGTGGSFISVHFWKTTWHSYNVMQIYPPIQCQWLLRLPRQAIHILINWDYRLNNLVKNGLSLREKPWFMFCKLQEKVFPLSSVSIHLKQIWTTVAFLLFPHYIMLHPPTPLPSQCDSFWNAQIKCHLYRAFLDSHTTSQPQLIEPSLLIVDSFIWSCIAM